MGLGDELRAHLAPRSPELCARAARKHAPWWGLAVYVVFWLFIAGTVGAAFLAAALSEMSSYWEGTKHADSLWIVCWTAMAALASWLLARWIRWRVREVRTLARDGIFATAAITEVTSTEALQRVLLRRGSAIGHFVYAQVGTTRYRAFVPEFPAWVQVGAAVELVGSPASIYAFMIAPDGTDFLAKQK